MSSQIKPLLEVHLEALEHLSFNVTLSWLCAKPKALLTPDPPRQGF
jgi:hypothetical protein